MTVTVSTFTDEKALQFLDDEEGDDANEDAQTDRHVVTVTLSAATVGMSVRLMRVTVASVDMAMSVSLLSHYCVGNQVQERVPKEATRREAEQNLKQSPLLLAIVQVEEEEDDEGKDTDQERRS